MSGERAANANNRARNEAMRRNLHNLQMWNVDTWQQNVLNRVRSGDVQLIWEKVKVNNLPKEDPILRNFNNSRKAIKVSWKKKGKTYSNYYTPESAVIQSAVRMYLSFHPT